MRYLVRLANNQGYTPKDVGTTQEKIRELLGSENQIGNLRISTRAIEFDLFAEPAHLDGPKSLLEAKISKVVTLRPIDPRAPPRGQSQALQEGVDLFNQERFWEAHEVLEEIWHPATGVERDVVQGLILVAAALVHYQKNENSVCLSILGRAREKLGAVVHFRGLYIDRLMASIEEILETGKPKLLQIESIKSKNPAHYS